MNEEEKKAIEELEEFIKGPCEICKYCEGAYKLNRKNIIRLLNLTKKLQKENKELKEDNEQLDAIKNEAVRRYNFESIPVSKVKGIIEQLDERIKNPERTSYWASYTISECIGIRRILQDLLERSREDEIKRYI